MTALNITQEQYETAIRAAKVEALREAAEAVDVDSQDVDYEEVTAGAGRRHAADQIRDLADALESA